MYHLDKDEYHKDFGDLIHGGIDVDWYSPLVYNAYFYNDIINNNIDYSDDIIDDLLHDKI